MYVDKSGKCLLVWVVGVMHISYPQCGVGKLCTFKAIG
jgi:hypothetical protein